MKHSTTFAIGMTSYNTEDFLKGVIEDLEGRQIVLKAWIVHHDDYFDPWTGEERKGHYHVEMVCKPCDTDQLAKEFEEPDPNNDKPLGVVYDEKPTRLTLEKQIMQALLYDRHDWLFCQSRGENKPYYDLELSEFWTTDATWLRMVWDTVMQYDVYWSFIKKPSAQDITTAIIEQTPVYSGDRVLTAKEALKRHWINSFEYRNLVSADLDNMTARMTKLTYRYEELSKANAKLEKKLNDSHWEELLPENSPF